MNTELIAKLRQSFGRDPVTGRTNNNTSANNNQEKIVNVNYGHAGSGKLYSYRDPQGTHKTGDNVVVPVKNPKSGKEYNTLATIRSTHGGNTGAAMDTRNQLSNDNIQLKAVTNESQRELPNYYAGWGKDAVAGRDLKNEILANTENGSNKRREQMAMLRYLLKNRMPGGANG